MSGSCLIGKVDPDTDSQSAVQKLDQYIFAMTKIHKSNIKVSSFESNGNIQKKESGSYCAISDNKPSSVTLNKLAMNCVFKTQLIP